jgi:hypothetical protein
MTIFRFQDLRPSAHGAGEESAAIGIILQKVATSVTVLIASHLTGNIFGNKVATDWQHPSGRIRVSLEPALKAVLAHH